MINYNIMNIILDKKAFEEWQDKVIKVHKEFDKKYGIIVKYNGRFLEIDINEIYNGNFINLFTKDKVKCINCNNYYHVFFNHRNIKNNEYYHQSVSSIGYISSIYIPICVNCIKVELPKNYW